MVEKTQNRGQGVHLSFRRQLKSETPYPGSLDKEILEVDSV